MTRLYIFIIFCFVTLKGVAQTYGNEWVNFALTYYKINTGANGIYRLTYTNLNNVGFPVGQDNQRIQLFHRGQELAIYVEDANGNDLFDAGDFIEFYGQVNDGTLDAALYQPASAQPHAYYNLYSDTTAYFITHNPAATGKRIANLAPFTGGTIDTYHFSELISLYTSDYLLGVTQASYNSQTYFDVGEGFSGTRITENSNPVQDVVLSGIDQTVVSAPNPQLELQLVGRNEQTHSVTIEAGASTGSLTTVGTYGFSTFNTLTINEAIDWSSISGSGTLTIRITVNTNGGENSNVSVNYIRLTFAQALDMGGALAKEFNLLQHTTGGNEVTISNLPGTVKVYDITDAANVSGVPDKDTNPNTFTAGFEQALATRKLFVNEIGNYLEPTLTPVRFRSIDVTANYLVISHSSLMQSAGGYPDAVRAYAGYRASAPGGSFDTLVVDIEQLYNQFSYGEITPLAIYRFMQYMADKGNPAHLFIIGKALVVATKFYRRPKTDFTYYDLVPTAGQPGSDLTFTAGLKGAGVEAGIPVGRLGASQPDDIVNYLAKVMELEATPFNALWRKHTLHLSGGNTESELASFRSYVDSYASTINGPYLGGEVTTQSKTTSAPVEFINVSKQVNAGVNQITFFGHSAPNVTDIDIGFVSDPVNGYNNKGKYPLVLMNGCNAGNIYNDDYIFGEDWVLTPNLGSTAVIAHTSYGFSAVLNRWSSLFHSIGYGDLDYMDKSIGEIMLEASRQLLAQLGGASNPFYTTQVQQMGLHGDPAIKLFGTRLPDYEISLNNVEPVPTTEQGVTAEADTFALALAVRNFGAFLQDSLEVFVRRTLQDGTVIDYDTITFSPVRYQDTLRYPIPNNYEGNHGANTFEIVLDPAEKLPELDELNNRIFFNYFIPISGTIHLAPLNFSIVNSQPLALQAQISNQPANNRAVLFEFDTNDDFNAPVTGEGTGNLLVSFPNVSVPEVDSLAYYWRSKYRDLAPGEADQWTTTSFTYIKNGEEGWAQVALPQYKANKFSGMLQDDATLQLKFEETKLPIEVTTFGSANPATNFDVQFLIDGQAFILGTGFQSCADNRLAIVAFNHKSAAPYAPVFGGQVDAWTCGRSPQVINIVADTNPAFLDQVLDAIAPNDYVLLFTIGNFDFNAPGISLTKLTDLGADVANLTGKANDEPYIMFGRKGSGAGNAEFEILADPASAIPANEQMITTPQFSSVVASIGEGSMQSPVIGPAFAWGKLTFSTQPLTGFDKIGVDVVGLDLTGKNETILSTGIQISETDLSWIDPVAYPMLYLTYHVADTVAKTPAQLQKWLVTYEPSPEGIVAFLGNNKGNSLQVEVQEGDSVKTTFGFINVSDKTFTADLPVTYTVFNADTHKNNTGTLQIPAPAPGDTTLFSIPLATKGLVGTNNITVFVNNYTVPEQRYVNNNLSLTNYVTVVKDKTNPLLDVSIDGRYIFDGEIVSPNPTVLIKILDKNPLLQKTDTTGIQLFITPPCEGCSARPIALSSSEVEYTVATPNKPFEIYYRPKKLENGMYELSIQAEDASGNAAGAEPYKLRFEVVNEATVTNFYPYPNPFSSSVRFVFTLTGSQVPESLMIRIMTVSGRVVRTITQDEIGPIHIGNNKTEYAWDGRDEFGDPLANGVYLYKVLMELNGERVELRSSAGDRGFKNGYGKLYLLR